MRSGVYFQVSRLYGKLWIIYEIHMAESQQLTCAISAKRLGFKLKFDNVISLVLF